MRRIMLALAAGFLAVGPPADVAEAARAQADCKDWCAQKAVENCDDVSNTWCNAYIAGCLAGCGMSRL